jgi:hypothetical protein
MKVRRYYDVRKKYVRFWFPEVNDIDDFLRVMKEAGYDNEAALQIDNAEYEYLLSDDEQESWFFDCLQRVHDNPGFYLDNLDHLPVFRVNIKNIFPAPVSGPGRLLKRNKKERLD